ncbi:MAG: tetratricopeptide repeat protein, partial [Bdellovibrionales bacterium]|nr:tetratricopeptide repeat protein [Bdellovibrionales bacterium]
RYIGKLPLRGKTIGFGFWEVYQADPENSVHLKNETLDLFNQAIIHFENNQKDKAKELFEQVLQRNPDDEVTKHYLQSKFN